jgi:hypothetical protein
VSGLVQLSLVGNAPSGDWSLTWNDLLGSYSLSTLYAGRSLVFEFTCLSPTTGRLLMVVECASGELNIDIDLTGTVGPPVSMSGQKTTTGGCYPGLHVVTVSTFKT